VERGEGLSCVIIVLWRTELIKPFDGRWYSFRTRVGQEPCNDSTELWGWSGGGVHLAEVALWQHLTFIIINSQSVSLSSCILCPGSCWIIPGRFWACFYILLVCWLVVDYYSSSLWFWKVIFLMIVTIWYSHTVLKSLILLFLPFWKKWGMVVLSNLT
jgi:hypothetical protein